MALFFKQNYSSKTNFETRRKNQYFERQNKSTSRPSLDLNPFGANMTNRTTSPIDSITVATKTPEPTPLARPMNSQTLPTDLPEQNGKVHVPGDPDPDPSSSDSSLNKPNFLNASNSIKSIKNKRDMKKKR